MRTPEENQAEYRSKCLYRRSPTTIEKLQSDETWKQVFTGTKNAVKRKSRELQEQGGSLYVL